MLTTKINIQRPKARKFCIMSKSDKELFREYLKSKEPGQADSVGTLYLMGHECFGIDQMLRDVVNSIIYADPQPVEELDFLLEELRGLVHNLAHVRQGFVAYKAAHGEAA
ncbi:hypothetical protein [Shinella zoogloeoides]|uniref:Uncharacterized protein n=1 Tax=Shinella zoogloeoides TaxID=352475 RepID=A0A6N8TL30_SHIZO|nr:hypothetical protein [Shinella zoogloeoides]MXO03125.1 hypothetical protein [Shinella zoogloeoides]UEX83119.1 hypothetical protein K8M09_07580 [Shinella zoogloeoides]